MNNAPSPQVQAAATDLARRIEFIFAPLLILIAARFRILGPVTLPLWKRINRTRQTLARLLATLAAGRLPRRQAPRPGRGGSTPIRLPTRHGWLLDMLLHEAAVFTMRLNALLDDPAMIATLAAAPGVARKLRPISRLLGISPPPALRLPERPRKPAAAPSLVHSGTPPRPLYPSRRPPKPHRRVLKSS
jgi:hypothetical protein